MDQKIVSFQTLLFRKTLWLILLAAVIISVTVGYMAWMFKLNTVKNAIQSIADQAANLINLDIEQTQNLLETTNQFALTYGENHEYADNLVEKIAQQNPTKYIEIAWLNSEGNSLASSQPNQNVISYQNELNQLRKDGEGVVVSDTIAGENIPYIIFLYTNTQPYKPNTYLIAKVSLRGFWHLFNPKEPTGISFGKTGRGILLNQYFQIIGHSEPAKAYSNEAVSIQDKVDPTKDTQEGEYEDVFFSIKKIQLPSGKHWWLMVTLSKSEVYDSAYRTVFTTFLLLVLVTVVLLYYTTKAAKDLSKPIRNLCAGTKNIAEGDFSYRLYHHSNIAEAIELQDHFNDMASKLQDTLDKLTKADRLAALGTMASIVAHEIRNPLSSIVAFSIPLKKRVKANDIEFLNDFDEVVPKELNRLNDILNDFLDFARPQVFEYDEVDLNDLIMDIVQFIELGINKNEKIVTEFRPDIPVIQIDKKKLRQVFINLCKNGLEACEENNATVKISTDYEAQNQDEFFIVRVSDTGTGIPESIRDTLFEPFQTTKRKGTGLGLAISQRIIEEHGGTIEVESTGIKGTVFKITLKKGQN